MEEVKRLGMMVGKITAGGYMIGAGAIMATMGLGLILKAFDDNKKEGGA